MTEVLCEPSEAALAVTWPVVGSVPPRKQGHPRDTAPWLTAAL